MANRPSTASATYSIYGLENLRAGWRADFIADGHIRNFLRLKTPDRSGKDPGRVTLENSAAYAHVPIKATSSRLGVEPAVSASGIQAIHEKNISCAGC